MLESEDELLLRVARLLDALKFPPDATRDQKWRTTDQIVNALGLSAMAVKPLDQVLHQHEKEGIELMEKGVDPERRIRRAKYPQRTTALPLWGSTQHHGQPWIGLRPDRSDPPEDLPSNLVVPEGAPHVFLSHASSDGPTALRLAEALAGMGVGCWRFETEIEKGSNIADCVRTAIAEADAIVGFVTRTSIASLWILTELHTALKEQKVVALVVDSNDKELLRLLESACFHQPDLDFDQTVDFDRGLVTQLQNDYVRRTGDKSRTVRYEGQVADFMATLPLYLGTKPSDGPRVWRPALSFPSCTVKWPRLITLGPLEDLPLRLHNQSL